jgi:hypothetical protein
MQKGRVPGRQMGSIFVMHLEELAIGTDSTGSATATVPADRAAKTNANAFMVTSQIKTAAPYQSSSDRPTSEGTHSLTTTVRCQPTP